MPDPATAPAASREGLRAVLGPFDATMIVMGSIIGAGIFRVPAQIAGAAGDARWILALWVLGGAVSLCGALVFAELGASLPRAGGQYVFVREAFGRCAAFLLGWVLLTAVNSGAVAYVAGVFAEHLETLAAELRPGTHFGPRGRQGVAVALIAGLTVLNARGLRLGATVQNAAMLTKLAGLLLIIGLGAAAALGLVTPEPAPAQAALAASAVDWRGLGAALISVTFAYGGFQNVAAAAGELRDPQRDLPRAIAVGTLAVIALYLALNVSLVAILGVERLAASPTPVAEAAGLVLPGGEALVAVLVLVSTFAIVQVILMVLPRIFYAMAQDGLFFASVARVHPLHGTPHVAVAALGALSVLHVLLASRMHDLLEICSLCDWVFFALCALALFVLRARRPDLPRPFRVPGYPLVPGLFVLSAFAIVANILLNAQLRPVLTGLGLFALGGVFYALWSRRGATSAGR
jgi:APA family basic amino acid/polyamine antiporter